MILAPSGRSRKPWSWRVSGSAQAPFWIRPDSDWAPSWLRPEAGPLSTATSQDGGAGATSSVLANLSAYHELGWFWGALAALGWKGCYLACVAIYTAIYHGSDATTLSLGLLIGRLILSAPALLYTWILGQPPPRPAAEETFCGLRSISRWRPMDLLHQVQLLRMPLVSKQR